MLEQTLTRERRLRLLPSRVGLYFVLAMCLFPGSGYGRVWAELTAWPGQAAGPVGQGAAQPPPPAGPGAAEDAV